MLAPVHYAQRIRAIEAMVRELLAAAQAERKAKLDTDRVDTVFKVGDGMLLLTKELLDAADIGQLRPRWDGLFTVIACPSPTPTPLPCHARYAAARRSTSTASSPSSCGPRTKAPPLVAPAGFRLAAPSEVVIGPALRGSESSADSAIGAVLLVDRRLGSWDGGAA